MKELVLSRKELQIVTNAIYRSDTRYIHVSYPFYKIELFTLDINKPELSKLDGTMGLKLTDAIDELEYGNDVDH